MKRKNIAWLVCCAVLAVIVVSAVLVVTREQKPQKVQSIPPAAASPEPSAPVAAIRPPSSNPVQAPALAPVVSVAPRRENVLPETGGPPQKVVRIKPESVLATVNGVRITLKDLVPLPTEKAGTEQMMSAEMYDFLFNRAIEREVTFQAARAQGVELTQDQKDRLAELRLRSEERPPGVFDTVGQNPVNAEFEQRDFAGLALQATLAERAGVSSPYVTSEQVETYFQAHKNDYPQIPEDPAQRTAESWATVDSQIRAKLAPGLQAEHDQQMSRFLADLKAKASVIVATQ